MNKKTLFLITAILLAATSTFSQTTNPLNVQKAGTKTMSKPGVSTTTRAINKDQMAEIQESMALEAAQAWLLKLGYDLTIDQVINLKSLTATGGTQERAQALTTENMKNLRVLKNLETLELAQFGNDDWVANCAGLLKMRSFVMLPASNLTDRSAEVFAKMPELVQLMIHGCHITDAGFAKLSGLKKLKRLGLQYAPITDASMPIIGQNTDLENMTLSFTNITDAGLPYLYNLKKLTYLGLQSQTLTPAAVAELRRQLPQCNVVYP